MLTGASVAHMSALLELMSCSVCVCVCWIGYEICRVCKGVGTGHLKH